MDINKRASAASQCKSKVCSGKLLTSPRRYDRSSVGKICFMNKLSN